MRLRSAVVIALGLALGAAPRLPAVPLLYGITQTGSLFTVDPTNTANVTVLGTVAGGADSLIGLATNGTNLYTFDRNSDTFLQIDTSGNTIGSAISVGFGSTTIGEGDFTFGSANSGFLASAQFPTAAFYSFTLGTPGSESLLHSDATATRVFLDGLAFGSGGATLYGLQQGGAGLYTINTTTGVPTLDGATTIPAGPYTFGGLGFDPNTSTMYGALANNNLANLFTFNVATGAGTLVGAIGTLTNVVGLAEFDNGALATPEPGTLVLLGAGLAAIAAGRKYRRDLRTTGRRLPPRP